MLRRRAGGTKTVEVSESRHRGASWPAETRTTDQERQLLPGAAGSIWMMHWNAGLAYWQVAQATSLKQYQPVTLTAVPLGGAHPGRHRNVPQLARQ